MTKHYALAVECKNGDFEGVAPDSEDTINEIYHALEPAEAAFEKLGTEYRSELDKVMAEFAPVKIIYELEIDDQDIIVSRSAIRQAPLSI